MFNIFNKKMAIFCYFVVLFLFTFSCTTSSSKASSSSEKKTDKIKITGSFEITGPSSVTVGEEATFTLDLAKIKPQETLKSKFELTLKDAPKGVTIKELDMTAKTFKVAVAAGTAVAGSKEYTFVLKVKNNGEKYEGSVEGKYSIEVKAVSVFALSSKLPNGFVPGEYASSSDASSFLNPDPYPSFPYLEWANVPAEATHLVLIYQADTMKGSDFDNGSRTAGGLWVIDKSVSSIAKKVRPNGPQGVTETLTGITGISILEPWFSFKPINQDIHRFKMYAVKGYANVAAISNALVKTADGGTGAKNVIDPDGMGGFDPGPKKIDSTDRIADFRNCLCR